MKIGKMCSACGKLLCGKVYPSGLCQSCYSYFRLGGQVNPLPPSGQVVRDSDGKVICHICGRSYVRLGSHIRESHGMTIAAYKQQFGLCNNAKTTEPAYSKYMSTLAYKNDTPEKLKISGAATRIRPGDKHLRMGKKSRLQECLERSQRLKEKEQDDEKL